MLVAADFGAAAVAWSLAFAFGAAAQAGHSGFTLRCCLAVAGLAVLSVVVAATQKLYWARLCAIRSVEIARCLRVSLIVGVAAMPVSAIAGVRLPIRWIVAGTAVMMILTVAGRGLYGGWLRNRRSRGHLGRPVVLIGDNDEGRNLVKLTEEHPEYGLRVVGVIRRPGDEAPELGLPMIGTTDDLPSSISAAAGAIVVSSAFTAAELNRVVRQLVAAGVHVHLSTGLTGISFRRLRPLPIAREPMLYIEQIRRSTSQQMVKRAMDVTLSSLLLVLSLPVLAAAAAAIKLTLPRARVIYRQQRVGRDGVVFTMYKLRTMEPGAASRVDELAGRNQRGGPLFKLARDPRVTPVGRFLRKTSMDELPQLLNVLKGDMSLVGPRPALVHEAAEFDEAHQARHVLTPGITGLWQVEARDNPSFDAYRRLDLFYLENWSVLLDVAIIWSTLMVVLGRSLGMSNHWDAAADRVIADSP